MPDWETFEFSVTCVCVMENRGVACKADRLELRHRKRPVQDKRGSSGVPAQREEGFGASGASLAACVV